MLAISNSASFGDLFGLDDFDLDFPDVFAPIEAKVSEPPVQLSPYQQIAAHYKRCQEAITHSDNPQTSNAAKVIYGRLFATLQSQEAAYWATNPEVCKKIANAFFESGSEEVRKVFETNIAAIFQNYAQNQLDLTSGLLLIRVESTKNNENISIYTFLDQLVNVDWKSRSKDTAKKADALFAEALADKLLTLYFIKKLGVDESCDKHLRTASGYILRHLLRVKTDPNTWKKTSSKELQKLIDKSLEQAEPEVKSSFAAYIPPALNPEVKKSISNKVTNVSLQLSKQKAVCEKATNCFLLYSVLFDIPLR